MRTILLLAVLVSVWAADAITFDGKVKDKLFEYRTNSQSIHLEHLEEKLEKVEKDFHKYEKEYPLATEKEVSHLKARITNLEEKHCRPKHVRCGKARYFCVNELHFCDGHNDCPNGYDESDEICDSKIVDVGRAYTGMVTWHSCGTFEPHNIVISIVTSDSIHHFSAYTKVKATVSYDHDEHPGAVVRHNVHSIVTHGYYCAGKRMLYLESDDHHDSRFAVKCRFNLGDDDTADCKILEKASLHVCATFRAAEV